MATETHIPDLLSLKKVETEDDVLSSETIEEKVKQVEISSQVAETVNTQLETGVPTNESGTFFQALSVPVVHADDDSSTPESCKAATTEDQEEIKTTKVEAFTEEKPLIASKEEIDDNSVDSQETSEKCDNGEKVPQESVNKIVPEETSSEKVEYDEEEINEKTTTILNKNEDQERKENAVTSSQDATFKGNESEVVKTKEESIGEDIEDTTFQHATTALNAAPKDIIKEEVVQDSSIDPQEDKREQEPEESVNKTVQSYLDIKQEEGTEVLQPSVETETQVESTQHDGQKEIFDSPSVKEVCEEAGSEKVEYKEEIKDTTNEDEIASKVEDQEKEQEVYVSEKGEVDVEDFTTSQDATSRDIEETAISQHVTTVVNFKEGQDPSSMTKEILKEEAEEKSNDVQEESEQSENGVKDNIEQNTSSFGVETKEIDEKAIVSKEDIEETEQDFKMSEEVQGGGDDVISSHNASIDDIKETTIGQHATTVAYFEDDSTMTKEILREEAGEKSVDVQEASEKCEDGAKEQKPEESVNKIVQPYLETEQQEDPKEIKPSVETEEKTDQQGLLHTATTDDGITSQTESHVESAEHEVKSEEANQSDDTQKETFDSPTVKEVCEETGSENVEYKEEVKETTNENEVASKVEDQEVYVSGKGEVTSSEDATYESIKESTIGQDVTTVASFEEEAETKSIDAQETSEQYENEYKIEQNTSSSSVETKENEEKIDEEAIVNDDGQSKKSESELNENEIVSKEGNEENEKEVKMSEEVEDGGDDIISSQNASTEDIIETTLGQHATTVAYVEEGRDQSAMSKEITNKEEEEDKTIDAKEASEKCDDVTEDKKGQNPEEISNKVVESSSEIEQEEDTEETKSSVEMAQQVCEEAGSEKIEYKEEVKYSDSSNTETMVKEVCEEKAESEEGSKLSDNLNIGLNENAIASKVEDEEKEQEVIVSGKGQDGEDDVTSSQDTKCEDIKETTIGQHVTTETYLESTPREILKEEVEDKSSDAQEASEQHESGANEKIEQKSEEESVNKNEEIKPSTVEIEEKEQVNITCDEEDVIEKIKFEGVELSDKDEEQERIISEEDQGTDDVTCLQDATSIKEPEIVKPRENIEEDTEEIKSSSEIKDDIKIDEDAIVNDDDQNQTNKSESLLVKEVCEATSSKKVEPELNENEKVSTDENQEKEQEVKMSEEVDDIKETKIDQHATTMTYSEEGNNQEDKKEHKSEESDNKTVQSYSEYEPEGDGDTEEIKPSVETECITSQTESQVENEVKSGEPIQSGDGQQEYVNSSSVNEETDSEKVEYSEEVKETARKIKNEEKEQEVSMSGKDQGDDVTSSQDTTCEDVKEPLVGQHVTTVAYLEEGQAPSSMPKEETKETEEKNEESIESDDGQMEKTIIPTVKEVCDETISKKVESESEEGVKAIITLKDEDQEKDQVEIVNVIEDTEEIKPIEETYETKEQVEITRHEFEDSKNLSIKEVCEETHTEKVECEGVELENESGTVKTRESIEEDTEEVIYSVETKENEEKIEEEAIVNNYGQTKESEIPLVKEVCEVIGSENAVESEDEEELQYFESSSRELLNPFEIVSKEENQEKEQEPEEVKETMIGQHVITVVDSEVGHDQREMTKEILKEEAEDKSSDAHEDKAEQKPEESDNKIVESSSEIEQEKDSEEIKPSVETAQQELFHAITSQTESRELKSDEFIQSDDGQKENVDSSQANLVCEETSSEKVEDSEEVKETTNEKEIASKVEDEEKEQAVYEETTKEVCDETSSKNVESEEGVKAIETFKDKDQEKDQVEMSPEGQGKENVTTSEVAASEDDLQEKKYQEEGKEPEFFETSETLEEDTKYISSTTNVITNDVHISTETESLENEEKIEEEAIVNDDGQTEMSESLLVEEVFEVTRSQKVESELNENVIVSKEENKEKEHELKMPEEIQGGGDDVTASEDATCEDIKEPTIGQHESALTKEILKEEAEDKSIDAQEASEQYDQNEEKDTTDENANIISRSYSGMEQEEYTEEIKPSVETEEKEQKEVYEETDLKKTVSEEGIKLPDSSNMYVNEKEIEILSKDEYQEKEQELNIPEKDQCEDEVAASEKDLQVNEHEFVETRESVKEDNEVIINNVETEERLEKEETTETEEKNKEPITTDVEAIETFKDEDQEKDQVNMSTEGQCEDNVTSSQVAAFEEDLQKEKYQEEGKEAEFVETRESIEEEDTKEIKSGVETTKSTEQNEEQIEEEAIVNDDGQTEKSESLLVNEVSEVTVSEKAESELIENEIVSKEEVQEKEQEVKISEEVKGCEDDVTSSQIASSEDIKETEETLSEEKTEVDENNSLYEKGDVTQENQPISTEDCSEISKDVILTKEIEQVPLETETEKGTNGIKEQIVEDDIHSTEDQKISEIDESPKQDFESVCDVQTPEVVADSDDLKVTEESIVSNINSENIMENIKFTSNEKELSDEVSSELGQPKGQIVDELQTTPTETISETIEDEITKEEENISHGNIEDANDTTTTIEEKCFEAEKTRETEPVEELNDGLNEASNEKSLDLKETTEPHSTSLEYTPNSEKDKEENKILPIEDVESIYDAQIPEVGPKSEESNLKEDCLTSATTTYVDEEKETVAKEISSDEKTEQTTEIGEHDSLYEKEDIKEDVTQEHQLNSTEHCSEMSKDVILTEEVSYSDPIPVGVSEVKTDEISSIETTESKPVAEHLSISSRDAVLIKENLEVHGEVKPTSESVIEEDQVTETKPEPLQSDITSQNIMSEKDMEEDVTIAPKNQNETIKNVILTHEVAVETEKEKENNEVKEHVSEEDICPTETDNTSTSNQKELADEKPVSIVRPEEIASLTVEDQTNELVQNLELTEEELPKKLVTEEKTLEEDTNMEKETVGEYADIHKLEEKPTEVFEIASEVDEVVPECSKVSENLPENVPEASPVEKNEPETTTTIEKIETTSEVDVIDVQKQEKAFEYTTDAITVDDISTKEAKLESVNQEIYQSEQKKEADETIEREIPTEKEPVELDAPVTPDNEATQELEISQKHIPDDLVKISQTQPEIQKYEGSTAKSLIFEPENKDLDTEPQCSSEVFNKEKKTSDEKENTEVNEKSIEEREKGLKEEIGEKGGKTEEENEDDDDEDNHVNGAPVMVEASKDIEVKAHKKSHNILSGVGSKVKHSIAKVKKAITGKSSSPKPSSPKEKDQVIT